MKKVSKNIQAVLVYGTLVKLLGLIYKIVVTRTLGLEGMRLVALVLPTMSLALCLSSMCLPTVVNQNVASNILKKQTRASTILKSAFHITFISSSIISVIILLSFPLYKIIYQNSFIYYPLLTCIPLIYLSNCSGILKGYLEANSKFHTTYFSNFLEQIAKIALSFISIYLCRHKGIEWQVFACFSSMALSEFVSFFYLVFKVKKITTVRYQEVETNGYEKSILKQAFPLTIVQLIGTITNYLEPFVFYYASSILAIPIYDATIYYAQVTSYAIPLLIFAFFGAQSIAKFTFPKITKLKDQKKELNLVLSKSFFLCFLVSIFNFMICFFYAKESLLFLFADDRSSNIVHMLAPLYFCTYLNPLLVSILQAYQKEKKLLFATILSSICSIIFIFVLTIQPRIQLSGFVIGVGVSSFLRFLLLLFFSNQCVHFQPRKRIVFLLFSIFGLYFAFNYFVHSFIAFLIATLILALASLVLYRSVYKSKVAS